MIHPYTWVAIRYGAQTAEKQKATKEHISAMVCSYFKVSFDSLLPHCRYKEIVEARSTIMYLLRHHSNITYKQIGVYLGGRDHTSVIHAVRSIQDRIDTEPTFKCRIESITHRIVQPDEPLPIVPKKQVYKPVILK